MSSLTEDQRQNALNRTVSTCEYCGGGMSLRAAKTETVELRSGRVLVITMCPDCKGGL